MQGKVIGLKRDSQFPYNGVQYVGMEICIAFENGFDEGVCAEKFFINDQKPVYAAVKKLNVGDEVMYQKNSYGKLADICVTRYASKQPPSLGSVRLSHVPGTSRFVLRSDDMPFDISDFLIDCMKSLWSLFTTNGFLGFAILFVKFIAPKIFRVFDKSVGH